MNNRLYEYMRLGKAEDEKKYKEELFDTKKIVKVTDADIKAYNEEKNNEKKALKEKQIAETQSEPVEESNVNEVSKKSDKAEENESYIDNYRKETDSSFYHYRSPFSKTKKQDGLEAVNKDYNTIDSDTQLMGLLGKDSLFEHFPWIHKEIAYVNGFNYSYNAFNISGNKLEDAINGGLTLGIKGFNVANEYKESIIPKLKAIGKSAYLIGAVDTLVYKEDGYYGFNTKMAAIKRCLLSDRVNLEGRNVIVAGSNDSVNALIVAAADLKARSIVVLTENKDGYDSCINRVLSTYNDTEILVITPDDDYMYEINQLTTIKNFKWICFYTGEDMPDDVDLFERIEVGYDLTFDRISTEFTTRVLECEGLADNGLRIHIYQAIASYELWSGKKVPQGTADYIYKKMKKKLYK